MIFNKPSFSRRRRGGLLLALTLLATSGFPAVRAQQFSEIVVFGDSLSDTGNIANRTEDIVDLRYPGSDFNYTNGRFTNGKDTSPKAKITYGVWHEQLAKQYLGIDSASASTDGGKDYAFGGAKTIGGVTTKNLASDPIFDQKITVDVDNMGKQVDDYLKDNTPRADGLFIVWGGGNDLFDDPDSATVTQTANNVSGLITKLATAGARFFIVPNVPPLGLVPEYKDNADKAAQLNQASADYQVLLNTTLDQTEAALTSQGITVTIYRLDIFAAFMRFVQQPESWGFVNITDSAQDTDANPNKYLFWDGIHPTTVGHAYIAAAAYTLISGKPVVLVTNVASQLPEVAGAQGEFFITRFGEDLSTKLKVPFELSGTATPDSDYRRIGGKRKLRINKRYQLALIDIYRDTDSEDDETITMTLTGTENFTPAGKLGTSTITIMHNTNE